MKIKPMLMRLEGALGHASLTEQILLKPESQGFNLKPKRFDDADINLVAGYDGSPNSQTALDLTLCIAHQTRLATQEQVVVHIVYVVPDNRQLAAAEDVLCQARYLADEWCGTLCTHLRVGDTATELQSVLMIESADLLLLGCRSIAHPLVRQLAHISCPILGIPSPIEAPQLVRREVKTLL